MSRAVDDIIASIREYPFMSPVEKQVLIARVDKRPTEEEYAAACLVVDAEEKSGLDLLKIQMAEHARFIETVKYCGWIVS